MKLLFLTDDDQIAAFVERCGVERVFVDLEQLGKAARQQGFDTVISTHRPENISRVKAAVTRAEVLVRTNPLHAGSPREIDFCIDAGADLLMLPMFRSSRELQQFCRHVQGRAPVIPLVETGKALEEIAQIVQVDGVSEVYFGLNDLRLDLRLSFLFEVVSRGLLEEAVETCRAEQMPFGIGGIATLAGGAIPGESVLGEYVRLGSSATILSRAFHQKATSLEDLQSKVDLPLEISRLRRAHRRLQNRSDAEILQDQNRFRQAIDRIVCAKAA